jgi:hypothetical protein
MSSISKLLCSDIRRCSLATVLSGDISAEISSGKAAVGVFASSSSSSSSFISTVGGSSGSFKK